LHIRVRRPHVHRTQETPIRPTSRSPSTSIFLLLIASAALSVNGRLAAQTLKPATEQADLIQPSLSQPSAAYSSSVVVADPSDAVPDAPILTDEQLAAAQTPVGQKKLVKQRSMAPFHRLGIAVTGGTEAAGLQIATSMGQHFNLRASGNYFSYFLDFNEEGYDVTGHIIARYANLSLDYYPWRHSGFRISPGVALDNGNYLHGNIVIPAGQSFDLGDATYTSGDGMGGNPISGVVALNFAHQVAPTITVGWGNLIPRGRHHFSIPFEIGFEYTGAPTVDFNIQGYACDSTGDPCQSIAGDPTTQANVQAEKTKLNNDLSLLRFYPIMSIGFGWSWERISRAQPSCDHKHCHLDRRRCCLPP
jgi:hypothetical protein